MVGVGVGTAAAAALEPLIEPGKQQAWANSPNRILDVGLLARLVAQGGLPLDSTTYDEANRDGYGDDKLRALVYLSQTVPGFAEAMQVWRRDPKGFADLWSHALIKQGLDPRYYPGLNDLFTDRLSPQVVALAIVRGLMRNPDILPVGPPTTEGRVKAFPVSQIDPVQESISGGMDFDRLSVLAGIMGRPMGPESAAAATFRGILERADYDRAISEGDVRNEWADAIYETARQIPSVADYINAELRGWITTAERNTGIARHGMSPADGDLLYLRTGRPAAPGQMATAVARGIDGPDGRPMDKPQFLKGIKESDIRPEWGEMLWGIRYAYPPLFQIGRLVQSGAITAATAVEWAKNDRYAPEVIAALEKYWLTLNSGAASDPHIGKAQTQLWTAIHRSFIAGKITPDVALSTLMNLIPDENTAVKVIDLWEIEKGVTIKELTPSQIKKRYTTNQISVDEAVVELERQNYTEQTARDYLTT